MRRADRPAHAFAPAYAALQIVLHWVSASLLCGLFALGFHTAGLAKSASEKAVLVDLHKSLGLTAALVITWRVMVCASRAVSPSIPGLYCWETELARITHRLLYICMTVTPASSYLGPSFNLYGTCFWGVSLPPWGWVDSALQHMFYVVYSMTTDLLFCLAMLHIAGVIKHQRVSERRCV